MECHRRHYLKFVYRDASGDLSSRILPVASRDTADAGTLASTLATALRQVSDEDISRIAYFEFFDRLITNVVDNKEEVVLQSDELDASRVFDVRDFNLQKLKQKGRQLAYQ